MSIADPSSSLFALWGAGLSTMLALIKVWELWRDRFRIELSHDFTSDIIIGNNIFIRNLTNRPLILTHWELQYGSSCWPFRCFESFECAEHDEGDTMLEPHTSHTLRFAGGKYFDWGSKALHGRRIFMRIHIAGRSSSRLHVFSN